MLSFPAAYGMRWLAGSVVALAKDCADAVGAEDIADVGPVFLPVGPALRLHRNPEERPTGAERAARLAVCCFGLSLSAPDERRILFDRLCRLSGHALLLDFKSPERNLEWPAFLVFSPLRRAVSRGHPERDGGMEGVLYHETSRFTILSRHTLMGGALCAVLLRNRSEEAV